MKTFVFESVISNFRSIKVDIVIIYQLRLFFYNVYENFPTTVLEILELDVVFWKV